MFKKTLMGLTVLSLGLSAFAQLYDGRWKFITEGGRDGNWTYWLDTKSVMRDGVWVKYWWMASTIETIPELPYQSQQWLTRMNCERRESQNTFYRLFESKMGIGAHALAGSPSDPLKPFGPGTVAEGFFRNVCR